MIDPSKLKPFDLIAALKGTPVYTRNGLSVHITGVRTPLSPRMFPVIKGTIPARSDNSQEWFLDGTYIGCSPSGNDLFMGPIKKTLYINITRHSANNASMPDRSHNAKGILYETKETAIAATIPHSNDKCIRPDYVAIAVPIEVEL